MGDFVRRRGDARGAIGALRLLADECFSLKLRAQKKQPRVEGAVLQFGPGATELCLEHLATEPWYARAARDWRVCRDWSSVLECLPPPA